MFRTGTYKFANILLRTDDFRIECRQYFRSKISIEKVFFAYENETRSGSSVNVNAIVKAKGLAKSGKAYTITAWEDLKNNGRILINAIFDTIDECDIFACDLTYLNHNVLFELGYAIASKKTISTY